MAKPLWVRYYAADFLAGTLTLSPAAELAYRRICDMIYNSGDRLIDDDEVMKIATKAGKRWLPVKRELLAAGKISIYKELIIVQRCSKEVLRSEGISDQRRGAAMAGVAKRKSLKKNKTGSASGSAGAEREASGNPTGCLSPAATELELERSKQARPARTGAPARSAHEGVFKGGEENQKELPDIEPLPAGDE